MSTESVKNFETFFPFHERLFYFICMHLLPECMKCTKFVPGTHGSQKRILSLELELQMAVSHCMGAENYTWVLHKNKKCF